MSDSTEYATPLAGCSAIAAVTPPRVHTFDSSREAYDASQYRDDIHDGDLLVIRSEGIIAVLHGAWPVALTEAHGELQTLTVPIEELDDGRYRQSLGAAISTAAELELQLAPQHRPAGAWEEGDRFVSADGAIRTVHHTGRTADGHLWLYTPQGSAWRGDRSERIDGSRVGEAKVAARRAGAILHGSKAPGGDAAAHAVRELGEALRYLSQAAPEVLEELADESTRRISVELPRLSVVPGDIIHTLGVRLHVLGTGIQDATGDNPRWWADVHGVDLADRTATYRAPWRMALAVEHAAWDLLTVERIAPVLAH